MLLMKDGLVQFEFLIGVKGSSLTIFSFFLIFHLNPEIRKRVFGCSPHLYGIRSINYRAI